MNYSKRIHFISSETEIPHDGNTKLIEIDCSNIRTTRELFSEFSNRLEFPSYFGHNWDAFSECFWDMEWIKDKYSCNNLNIYFFNMENLLENAADNEKIIFFRIINSDYDIGENDYQGKLNFPINIQLFFNKKEKKFILPTEITILWNSK
ncbi:MAG: barstar family protein [Acetobacter sp.]|nr:barstar family protein [Acetobacter sp.]